MPKSLPKLHTYYIMEEVILAIKSMSTQRSFPLHALLYADWGVGKTKAKTQILDNLQGVYAFTLENRREYSPYYLLSTILEDAFSIGAQGRQKALEKLLSSYLDAKGIIAPVLIVDEAQFAFKHPSVLDFFKYLSEHPRIGFSYLFLVNEDVNLHHPLGERIVIRRAIPPMTEKTALELASFHGVEIEPEGLKLLLERKVRTLELDNLLFMAKTAGIERLDLKNLKALLKKLREEGLT